MESNISLGGTIFYYLSLRKNTSWGKYSLDHLKSRHFFQILNGFWQNDSYLSRFQTVGLPNFKSHLKLGPFANQPLFDHSKSRVVQISDPGCVKNGVLLCFTAHRMQQHFKSFFNCNLIFFAVYWALQFGQPPDLRQRQVCHHGRPLATNEGQRWPGPHLYPVHHGLGHHGAVPQDQGSQVPQTGRVNTCSRKVCQWSFNSCSKLTAPRSMLKDHS